jgi:hypothetical protein
MPDNDDVHTIYLSSVTSSSSILFVCSFPSLQYPDISNFFNLGGVVIMEHTRERDIMHGREQKFKLKSDEVGNKHMVSIMRAL